MKKIPSKNHKKNIFRTEIPLSIDIYEQSVNYNFYCMFFFKLTFLSILLILQIAIFLLILLQLTKMMKGNKQLSQINMPNHEQIDLPSTLSQLLTIYQSEEHQFIRIFILAKMKNIILRNIHDSSWASTSFSTLEESQLHEESKQPAFCPTKELNSSFSALFLKYLRKGFKGRMLSESEARLLFHVISLAIKYYFSEEQFKSLFNSITDFIDNHKERISTALQFFIEVIETIEYNFEGSMQASSFNNKVKTNHCRFQRHFISHHLNSMLMIANFFMTKSILKDNSAIEDGPIEDRFKLKVSEEHVTKILELLHKVISFDFIGQKYNESEEINQFSAIIIPTKNPKNSNVSEFEKWIKNSQWIKLYQMLYDFSTKLDLKLKIIQIFGDMARIHMKFFKNKINFRTHIENIVYSLADILSNIDISKKYNQGIKLSIAIGYNLLKLTSPLTIPIFFEINPNLSRGLLDNIRVFLISQVIEDNVFNSNIIYYYFKFFENLNKRLQFQKNTTIQEYIESNVRQICRNYENYLRNLLFKVYRKKIYENTHERYNFYFLKEVLDNYNTAQLSIYFSPFKIMKPRYPTVNTIQELVVYVCAKIQRSIYMLESYKLQIWEQEVALGMINQSIQKIIQWYNYTSYAKRNTKVKNKQNTFQESRNNSSEKKQLLMIKMEPIQEEYYEQIENQDQYCHLLRVICFFIFDTISEKDVIFKSVNKDHKIIKLISLTIELCFFSDLNEQQKKQQVSIVVISKIQDFLEMSLKVLEKCFCWQYQLYKSSRQQNKNTQNINKDYTEMQYVQMLQIDDKLQLIKKIQNIKQYKNTHTLTYLKKIQFYIAYNISKQLNKQIIQIIQINNLTVLKIYIEAFQLSIIRQLIKSNQQIILNFINQIKKYLTGYQLENDNQQIIKYLECIILMRRYAGVEIYEEFSNILFYILKQITLLINNQNKSLIMVDQVLINFLQKVNQQEISSLSDTNFQYLCQDIKGIIDLFYQRKDDIQFIQMQPKNDKIQDTNQDNMHELDNISQQDEQTQLCQSIYSKNNIGKQNINHNIKEQQQFSQIKSIYNEQQKMQIQTVQNYPIYIGYHEEKMNLLLNKYAQPKNNEQVHITKSMPSGTQKIQSQSSKYHTQPQSKQESFSIIQENNAYMAQIQMKKEEYIPMDIQYQVKIENLQQFPSHIITKKSQQQKDYVKQIQKMILMNEKHETISPQQIGDEMMQIQQINEDSISNSLSNQPRFQIQSFTKEEVKPMLIKQEENEGIHRQQYRIDQWNNQSQANIRSQKKNIGQSNIESQKKNGSQTKKIVSQKKNEILIKNESPDMNESQRINENSSTE